MGRWLLGKINYLFWSIVVSCGIMTAMSFSPKSKSLITSLLKTMNNKVQSATPQGVINNLPGLSEESPNALPVASEALGGKQISSSSNEYLVDNENYVLIKGNYYKARADNKYLINGETIFFVNNRRQATKDKEAELKRIADEEAAELGGGEVSMPVTPAQMMETLKKAQSATEKRNKALNELVK